jgi:hypothetical protein
MNTILLASLLALNADPQTTGQTGTPPGGQAKIGRQNWERGTDRVQADRVISSPAKVDGDWAVVYMERDGRKVDTGKSDKATIRNNSVTYTDGGKEHTLRLELGPMHTIISYPADNPRGSGDRNTNDRNSTDRNNPNRNAGARDSNTGAGDRNARAAGDSGSRADQGTNLGVYVLSQEYLVISLDSGMTGIADTNTGIPSATGSGIGIRDRPAAGTGAGARSGAGTSGGAGNDDRPQASPSRGTGDRRQTGTGTGSGTGAARGAGTGAGADLTGSQPQTSAFVLILRKASRSDSSPRDKR